MNLILYSTGESNNNKIFKLIHNKKKAKSSLNHCYYYFIITCLKDHKYKSNFLQIPVKKGLIFLTECAIG